MSHNWNFLFEIQRGNRGPCLALSNRRVKQNRIICIIFIDKELERAQTVQLAVAQAFIYDCQIFLVCVEFVPQL